MHRFFVAHVAHFVVCLSVCVLAALLSPANAAEPIEMPFVVQTPVEPRSRV